MVFSFSVGQQDAARRVLRHFAHMESDAAALWYILHNGQEATELGGHGHGEVVAKSGDLIADALEGVAEPAAVGYGAIKPCWMNIMWARKRKYYHRKW